MVSFLVALVARALELASLTSSFFSGKKDVGPQASGEGCQMETFRSIASRVYLDHTCGTTVKVYKPPLLIRLLYRLAFQAPFPYERNVYALKAAQYRRKIAGILTRYFFGEDLVAPALDIRCDDGSCAFVTELVRGDPAPPTKEARRFLEEVSIRFAGAGLPTWQLSPINPKAIGNILLGADGRYHIIDLESALVSPFVPLSRLNGALRDGTLPSFDDVDFAALRTYIDRNAHRLEQLLGANEVAELRESVAACEVYTRLWKEGEPRILGLPAARYTGTPAPLLSVRGIGGCAGRRLAPERRPTVAAGRAVG